MPPPPAPVAPLPGNASAIAPDQLWAQLTPSQQQQVRQVLIVIAQQWLDTHLTHAPLEELSHER